MIRRLISYFRPVWFRSAVALVCMAAVAALSTGTVWLMKYLIDHALADKDLIALQNAVILIVAGFGLKSIFWYAHTYLSAYATHTVARKLRDDTYSHLYTLSMGFFNEKSSSHLLARLTNDITVLQHTLAAAPTVFLRDGLTILGLIGFLFYTNFKFSLLCFSLLPIAAFVLVHLGKKSRRAGRDSQARMSDIFNAIHEGLTAMPIVKVFQNELREISRFVQENRRYFDVIMRLARIEARSSPIMEFIGAIMLAVILIIGGRDVINGSWSLGSFVAFMGAALSLYNPIKKFANVNVQAQQGLAAAERVFEILDQNATVVDASDAQEAAPISKFIEFSSVAFRYPTSPLVLEGINLTLQKGEVVALVGPSGSGKTTVAQLLLRFYDPASGSVSLDGIDFRNLSVKSLRRQMAVVTQETYLFNDSIQNNIGYGKTDATPEEIEHAARVAFAHDFIMALPNGYDTVIGERGARLSGGEKQRIAIARALIKNPAILVLDEATSALDTASEQMVQKALDQLLTGRTVLMIAHRLSTVRKADRIIVLENGRIKETGNHDELLSRQGTYRKLFELQAIA